MPMQTGARSVRPDAISDVIPGAAAMERRLILGVAGVTLLLLVGVTGVISRTALRSFEQEVRPEMGREAAAIGAAAAAQIERAVALGVPPDRLQGLEPFLGGILAGRPMLDSITLDLPGARTQVGTPRAGRAQDIAVPVRLGAGAAGTLHLGVNPQRLERSARDSKWDIAVVLLVALLATVEVLALLADRTVSLPLRRVERLQGRIAAGDWAVRAQAVGGDAAGRYLARLNGVVRRMNERRRHVAWLAGEVMREAPEARGPARAALARVEAQGFAQAAGFDAPVGREAPLRSPATARAPLFLYVLAEQLSTSFVPIYARSLDGGGWALAAGLPVAVFAGVVALASPSGAGLVGQRGARGVLALGCVPAAAGYLLAAAAESIGVFMLARAVSAVGYALITIACQAYLVDAPGDTRGEVGRGRSMAVFVMAAMTGALCGTAIGSVLADRVGYGGTFLVSAALSLAAGVLALRTMDGAAGRRAAVAGSGAWRAAMAHRGFRALVLCAAVPAKLVLTGFVFTLCPLVLLGLGDTQPEIGRQVMLYAGAMLLTVRAGAWVADRVGAPAAAIAWAGAASGVALLLPLVLPLAVAVPVAIAVVGLAQGVASAPMLAVVPALCPALVARVGVAPLYGYLRVGERIGSIAGPLVAAGLAAAAGFTAAVAVLGAVSLVSAGAYWVVGRRA